MVLLGSIMNESSFINTRNNITFQMVIRISSRFILMQKANVMK
jgi:hypothetical protein